MNICLFTYHITKSAPHDNVYYSPYEPCYICHKQFFTPRKSYTTKSFAREENDATF